MGDPHPPRGSTVFRDGVRRSKADEERESAEEFVKGRRRHPGIESAINMLNHKGFARSVALSVLAANVQTLGKLLMKKEREMLRRKLKPGFLAAA